MAPQANLRENVDGNKLDLSMSSLMDVPVKEIAAIKKATHLDLSNNEITFLPPSFCSLSHLIELDLSKNLIQELPESFGDLTSLKRLDLYGNQLSHLPLSFSRLKALKWLDLKNNPLVPKLAEIAGPCGDQQQCQQCARNVVAALTSTALQVEEERKKLLEVRLREQEIMVEELKKQEDIDNQAKKAKKKNKKSRTDKPQSGQYSENGGHTDSKKSKIPCISSSEVKSLSSNAVESDSVSCEKQQSVPFQTVFRLIFVCGICVLSALTGAVLFAAYDRKLFHETIVEQNILPNGTATFILKSAKNVEYALKHPTVREMRLQLIACFRSIVASVLNIYKTICQELPVYYDILKSKFT